MTERQPNRRSAMIFSALQPERFDEGVAAGPDNITRTEARRLFNILARGDREMTQQEFLNPPQDYQDVSQRVLQAED